MCKHKSGGMSKPSGAATPQGALSERTTASCPSHNCPPESSSVPASTSQSTSIQNQMQMNSVLSQDSQAKSSERASIPVTMDASWSDSSTNGTHNTLLSDLQCNVSLRTNVEDYSCLPKAFRESIESEDSVSEDSDSDVATEQSPMLLSQACSGYCTPPDSWNSSIFSAMGSNYKNIGTKSDCSPDHASENDQENSCIADSVKFSTFKSYQVFNNFQVPNSYIPPCGNGGCTGLLDSAMETFESQLKNDCCFDVEHGTKLLFARHKCKPIKHDSLTVDNHISVICPKSYEYIEPKSNDIVEELSLEGSCNSCMTATYSSSTINTDPIAGPSGLQRPNSIHWEIGAKDNDKEDEFRCRSYSLTPTVNFAVFESESASETEDVPEVFIPDPIELHAKQDENTKGVDEPFQIPVSSLGRVFPISPSAAQLSLASSYGDSGASICKICHMTAKENDPLISPCRCSGTMQYIHCGCLMRWLEISSKRSRKPASCELCQYQYHWHKKFKVFFCALVVAASSQFLPLRGVSGEYAASLGGAPVGLYGRSSALGVSEVHSASLAGAKVGLYGKDGGVGPRVLPLKRTVPVVAKLARLYRRPASRFPYGLNPYAFPYGMYPYENSEGPHASISSAGSIADALKHRTISKTFGYEGTYLPPFRAFRG